MADGGFKFMRGRSYRFVDAGITDGHQFKLYANGSMSSGGLGNTVATSTPAGCLDPDVAVDVTTIKTTGTTVIIIYLLLMFMMVHIALLIFHRVTLLPF